MMGLQSDGMQLGPKEESVAPRKLVKSSRPVHHAIDEKGVPWGTRWSRPSSSRALSGH